MTAAATDLAIAAAVEASALDGRIDSTRALAGGCIHGATLVTMSGGANLVAKCATLDEAPVLEAEAHSLAALAATETVRVPKALGCHRVSDRQVLLLEAMEPAQETDDAWRAFASALATLHQAPAGDRYGFECDNFLGTTAQCNDWNDDWVAFNADSRLGPQLARARDAALLKGDEVDRVQAVIDHLGELLPRRPHPGLLHGDLWAGNAMACDDGGAVVIAVIDPACSIGDGWCDVAMMQLFGGFTSACIEAYAAHVDDHDGVEGRIAVYQLYHLLNHLNLFGRGYLPQVSACARCALSAC